MKTDKVYLEKIIDAVGQIESYTRKWTFVRFKADRKTQSAVILQLILIGEEAKKVASKTRKNISLPWKQITGFRNKAVHEYFSLDLQVVWKTIREEIPKVKKEILDYLKK